jgi:secreted Zn-dependent insulinase-like peptidase
MKEDLAVSIETCGEHEVHSFTLFIMDVILTEKGYSNWELIYQIVFDYCESIADLPVDSNFFEEMKAIGKIKFQFQEKQNAYSYVTNLTSKMHEFDNFQDTKDILWHQFYPETLDEVIIKDLLKKVATKEKFNLFFRSQ